ncbi:unnamed protein product, partial [Laminaria digitata]
ERDHQPVFPAAPLMRKISLETPTPVGVGAGGCKYCVPPCHPRTACAFRGHRQSKSLGGSRSRHHGQSQRRFDSRGRRVGGTSATGWDGGVNRPGSVRLEAAAGSTGDGCS